MTIAANKPIITKPARVITPQCCAQVHDAATNPGWRQARYTKLRPSFDHTRCQRESTVKIDGKNYCGSHAGKIALKRWLAGELIERKIDG